MPPVDAYASYPHYKHHIDPVWPYVDQGTFHTYGGLGPGPLTIVAGFPDLRRSRHRQHVLIEHGAGETWGGTDPHYSGGAGRESVRLFVCPNQEVADRNLDRYPQARAVVANPRLEYLARGKQAQPEREDHRLRVVLSFHWDNRTWKATTSALPYYQPHFAEYARDPRIVLRGHAHPRIADRARKYYARAGIPWIADFAEVVAWADVYMVDNSSTLFEAKALGLDVVLLEAPWFPKNDGSLRFDRWVGIGPHAYPDTLVDMALHANHNHVSYSEAGGRMAAEIFGRISGSAQLVATRIQEVASDLGT